MGGLEGRARPSPRLEWGLPTTMRCSSTSLRRWGDGGRGALRLAPAAPLPRWAAVAANAAAAAAALAAAAAVGWPGSAGGGGGGALWGATSSCCGVSYALDQRVDSGQVRAPWLQDFLSSAPPWGGRPQCTCPLALARRPAAFLNSSS